MPDAAAAVLLRTLRRVHTLIGSCEPQPEREIDEGIAACQNHVQEEAFAVIENLIGEDAKGIVDLEAPRELLDRLSRYEAALSWYADRAIWQELVGLEDSDDPPVLSDGGAIARQALEARGAARTREEAFYAGVSEGVRMASESSLAKMVIAWAKTSLPPDACHLKKLRQEVDELWNAPADPLEIGDVYLALLLHANHHHIDLLAAAEAKFAIVEQRTYGAAVDGLSQHMGPDHNPALIEVSAELMAGGPAVWGTISIDQQRAFLDLARTALRVQQNRLYTASRLLMESAYPWDALRDRLKETGDAVGMQMMDDSAERFDRACMLVREAAALNACDISTTEEAEELRGTIFTARQLLDGSFNGIDAEHLYDEQRVNQAHRVLSGGFAPRETANAPTTELHRKFSVILERERTAVADALVAVDKAMSSREWLREGRGSFEADDERWKDEFGGALDAIRQALIPLRKIAADLSDCPESWKETLAARDCAAETLL